MGGFLLCLLPAMALSLDSAWPLVFEVPYAIFLHFRVVLVEEEFLVENFGEEYENYLASAPRWLC